MCYTFEIFLDEKSESLTSSPAPEISRELLNIWRDLDLSEGEDFDSDDSLRDPTFTLSKETDKSSSDTNSDTMVI